MGFFRSTLRRIVKFILNKTIRTTTPTIEVDGTLAVGVHRFQLVVENERGQRSKPAVITITVVRSSVSPGGGGIIVAPR